MPRRNESPFKGVMMKPNPVSFMIISVLMVLLFVMTMLVAVLSLDINLERQYTKSEYDASDLSSLSIKADSGQIKVQTHDKDMIYVNMTEESFFGEGVLDRVDLVVEGGPDMTMSVRSEVRAVIYIVTLEVTVPDWLPIRTIELNNGDVELNFIRSVRSASLNNGDLTVSMMGPDPEGTEVNCDNGNVDILLPVNSSFDFSISARNGGAVISGFDIDLSKDNYDEKVGEAGSGGPLVKGRVVNGGISIKSFAPEGGTEGVEG